MNKTLLLYCLLLAAYSCSGDTVEHVQEVPPADTLNKYAVEKYSTAANEGDNINTGNTNAAAVIAFARTLRGIPYKYASADPATGFDCSGFITYVFNHFNISVPRSSVDFTHKGRTVPLHECKPGDLILFTGTDSTIKTVGHMGIITNTQDSIVFIHATSGKANAVTESNLKPHYHGRFMKVVRVFEQ